MYYWLVGWCILLCPAHAQQGEKEKKPLILGPSAEEGCRFGCRLKRACWFKIGLKKMCAEQATDTCLQWLDEGLIWSFRMALTC